MTTKNSKRKIFYFITFLVGLISIYFEIQFYRKTIIPVYIPIIVIALAGLFATTLDYKNYVRTYPIQGSLIFASIQNTVSWGFSLCFIFMFINFYYPRNNMETLNYNIEEASSIPGSRHDRDERKPLIQINHKGNQKELVFSHEYYNQLSNFKTVTLVTREGFFGYDIIVEQRINDYQQQ